jgi:Ca2+-transporting ATPase
MSQQQPVWHSQTPEQVAQALEADLNSGLTSTETEERLARYGLNELIEQPRPGFWQMLLAQFNNFVIIILIVAASISFAIGLREYGESGEITEFVEAGAIVAIVILNAVIGVVQESKAEEALAALKKMAAPDAHVIRDGHRTVVPARQVVPGDLVLLEAGNYVPADLRLVETANLKIEEASLTGESFPVLKQADDVLAQDAPLGDRRNMAYMSTMVTYGRGRGMVTATGMQTQIGRIAEMIQSYEEEPTPLQVKLDQLGKWLGWASLAICGVVFIVGVLRDVEFIEMFLIAVSLAIAAVPEGLPAIVTINLAIGMREMARRNALIRRLPAVETLGSASAICSDKTGTLTQNEMMVTRLVYLDERGASSLDEPLAPARSAGGGASSLDEPLAPAASAELPSTAQLAGQVSRARSAGGGASSNGSELQLSGEGYRPWGFFHQGGHVVDIEKFPHIQLLLRAAALCNDAQLEVSEGEGEELTYRLVGDPTEGALVVAAAKAGLWREEEEGRFPRVAEVPFDSIRKRMTTVHRVDRMRGERREETVNSPLPSPFLSSDHVAFVKGAPDVILDLSTHILDGDQVWPLDPARREAILGHNQEMATQALRVLGVAYRPLETVPDEPTHEALEHDLVFIGLAGMIDPARPEVMAAIEVARNAGIRTLMVTGDYPGTARAIAEEIGLLRPGGRVVTGAELEKMGDATLTAQVDRIDVFARVSPKHKVRIVEALKARDQVVAMTGDGVNDAPALKRANIGVAMGITGTDVSKETADMVLTDDNYVSIVSAVEQGRIIYSNIRKFVYYLLSCNLAEIMIIFIATLLNWETPLTAIQLLWLNLLTDGAPALALGLEKGDPDVMQRQPRPIREPIINREMQLGMLIQTLFITSTVLLAFRIGHSWGDVALAESMAFVTLSVSELARAYTSRSEHFSLWGIGVFSNKYMQYAVVASLVLLALVVYVPFLQPIFNTAPLGVQEWGVMLPLIFVPSVAAEITKWFLRRSSPPAGAAAN